ncbi:MAG: DUF4124 domain-containing protein [Methylotenera sp.]|nr:DUF4124 domain-containing protein [Methylotenera sp.]
MISLHALLSGVMVLVLFQQAYAEETKKMMKWKDEKGVTHYSDRIPAQYSNRENSVINRQGIIVKQNKPLSQQDQQLALEKQEQAKKDKALLGAFTSADEIDLARDRHLQTDQDILNNMVMQKNIAGIKLTDNQKMVASLTKQKKPLSAELLAEIKQNQADVSEYEQRINQHKQSMELTRNRYDADKARYLAIIKERSEGVKN